MSYVSVLSSRYFFNGLVVAGALLGISSTARAQADLNLQSRLDGITTRLDLTPSIAAPVVLPSGVAAALALERDRKNATCA